MSRSRILLVALFCAALLSPAQPTQAASALLCSGYDNCDRAGYSHHGYKTKQSAMYWRMYSGTNCTNYVAYRLITSNGMSTTRPWSGSGNARDWGTAMASKTNQTPRVGSVAWWGRTGNHVAYVERVVSSTEIVVSESNWGRPFDWRRITKSGSGWPDGFIHFTDGTPQMSAPTGLRTTASTTSSLTFAWDDVPGADRYHVKVSTSPTMSKPVYGKFDESTGTVSGLEAGTTYYYAVVVVDPARNTRLSEYTSPISASTAMSAPTGLEVTSSTASSLTFGWDDVPGADRYHVKVSTSPTMSKPVYGKFDESKGTVAGLKPGTTYYYAVVVVDPARNARLSDYTTSQSTSTPNLAGAATSPPTGLKVTSSTASSLTFDWNDVPGAKRYHVKVSTSPTMSPPTFGKFDQSKGTVTGLKPGTTYYYAVVVVDPARNARLSDYTTPQSTSTPNPGGMPMAPPTGLKVTSSTASSLTFDWNDVPGAKRYHVKVSTSPTMSPPTFGKFDQSKGTVTGLKPGTTYYYAVVVVDPARNARLSDYTTPQSTSTPRS